NCGRSSTDLIWPNTETLQNIGSALNCDSLSYINNNNNNNSSLSNQNSINNSTSSALITNSSNFLSSRPKYLNNNNDKSHIDISSKSSTSNTMMKSESLLQLNKFPSSLCNTMKSDNSNYENWSNDHRKRHKKGNITSSLYIDESMDEMIYNKATSLENEKNQLHSLESSTINLVSKTKLSNLKQLTNELSNEQQLQQQQQPQQQQQQLNYSFNMLPTKMTDYTNQLLCNEYNDNHYNSLSLQQYNNNNNNNHCPQSISS
ncbi:uncharacterized protein DC041_0007896, partial [Schistosoma bovis]